MGRVESIHVKGRSEEGGLYKPAMPEVKGALQRGAGHVGFLGHGDRVEFRNILIRRLD